MTDEERTIGPKESERHDVAGQAHEAISLLLGGIGFLFGIDNLKQQAQENFDTWTTLIAEANETGVEVPTAAELEAYEGIKKYLEQALAVTEEESGFTFGDDDVEAQLI